MAILNPSYKEGAPAESPAESSSESSSALRLDGDALTAGAREYRRLRDKAYRLLARREHSAAELRRKLLQPPAPRYNGDQSQSRSNKRAVDAEVVARVIAELIDAGAQSDARFVEQRCRWRYQTGHGPIKLRHELAQHCIAADLIDQAMRDYQGKWRELADTVRCRKFGESRPASYAEWAKQARFLQQRGFASEHITAMQPSAADDTDDGDDTDANANALDSAAELT